MSKQNTNIETTNSPPKTQTSEPYAALGGPTLEDALEYSDRLPADCWADRCIILLAAEVVRLRAINADMHRTLREDKARLDWLEGQVHRGFYNPATGRTELSEFSCHEIKTHGIRAAIDAARRGIKP